MNSCAHAYAHFMMHSFLHDSPIVHARLSMRSFLHTAPCAYYGGESKRLYKTALYAMQEILKYLGNFPSYIYKCRKALYILAERDPYMSSQELSPNKLAECEYDFPFLCCQFHNTVIYLVAHSVLYPPPSPPLHLVLRKNDQHGKRLFFPFYFTVISQRCGGCTIYLVTYRI